MVVLCSNVSFVFKSFPECIGTSSLKKKIIIQDGGRSEINVDCKPIFHSIPASVDINISV